MLTRDSGTTSRRRMPVTGAGGADAAGVGRVDGRGAAARAGGDGAGEPSKGAGLGESAIARSGTGIAAAAGVASGTGDGIVIGMGKGSVGRNWARSASDAVATASTAIAQRQVRGAGCRSQLRRTMVTVSEP